MTADLSQGGSFRVMQFSALRYFLETARRGSIRRAAEVLYVAPSAISRQIALLEQNFGAPLLERHATGVRLTTAGEVFARQAHATVRDFERLQSEIDDLQQLRRGLVRISSVEATVAGLLFRTLQEFSRDYPGITYEIRVAGSVNALAALAKEECDIAITFEPQPHNDVAEIQAFRDPIVAIMPPKHPLASRAKLKLRDLADQRVAQLDETHVTRILMDAALALEGVTVQPVLTVTQVSLAVAFARTEGTLTFAPRHIVEDDVKAGRLKTALIDHPSLSSTRFVVCRHKTRAPTLPAQAFLIALQRQFTALDTGTRRLRGRR